MVDGIQAMQEDPKLLQAFKLANAAMALQHSWKPLGKTKPLRWRPFQLGFILLAAHSVCKADASEREVLDLLRSSTFIPSCSSLRQVLKLLKGLGWLLSAMLGLKCFLRISWMRSGLAG